MRRYNIRDTETSLHALTSSSSSKIYLRPNRLPAVFRVMLGVTVIAVIVAFVWFSISAGDSDRVGVQVILREQAKPVSIPLTDSAPEFVATSINVPRVQATAAAEVPPLQPIDNLDGSELSAVFEQFFQRAQDGDGAIAGALGRRLQECTGSQWLEQQERAATVQIGDTNDWAQIIDQVWRQRCIGLTVVQLDKAAALLRLAAQHGDPQALLEQALATLNVREREKEQASLSGLPDAPTLREIESTMATVHTLDSLAKAGNYQALDTLAGLYARGSIVAPDAEKFLIYQMVSQHDWSKPAQLMEQSSLLTAEEDPQLRDRALQQAVALFSSCCANKEKTP